MMRHKLFILALATMCLAFVSGVAVGVVGRRAFQQNKFQSVLVEELDLTPDQRHKIQQIWSNVAENHTPVPMAEIEKADAERWQAIDQLFTPRQRMQYARIQQRLDARMQELDQGNRERVARAQEQTSQLLTPAQREKYKQLLTRPTHDFYYMKTSTRPSH
jgi:Spy/CpxP family protein refolding chaperone